MAFHQEMLDSKEALESNGHAVLIPELAAEAPAEFGGNKTVYFGQYIEENGGIDAFAPEHEIWSLKEGAILDHSKKLSCVMRS